MVSTLSFVRQHPGLEPGVNFINVKPMNFSYKCRFGNVHVTRKKLPKPTFVRKIRVFNVDEIDTRLGTSTIMSSVAYHDNYHN